MYLDQIWLLIVSTHVVFAVNKRLVSCRFWSKFNKLTSNSQRKSLFKNKHVLTFSFTLLVFLDKSECDSYQNA